jgi:nicotinamide phosphoribosyltransferase
MRANLILDTDSYKASHFLQYPQDMQGMFSYLESRGGQYPKTVFFGLQYLLAEYISKRLSLADIIEAEDFFTDHGEPFPKDAWLKICEKYNGILPVRIRAVPEGTVVPVSNILMSVESTTRDPDIAWLPSWIETQMMRLWYPITVATQSFYCKKSILESLMRTADDPWAEIDFKLHDFGSRGVSSRESAAIGGAAHLVNFKGSDTVEGIRLANHYYMCPMAAFSIPAAEHSTITSWGRDREHEAYANMVAKFCKPGALVACVSDSYDLWHVIQNVWGGSLHQAVKDSGATLVIRPDSGEPVNVVLNALHMLDNKIGCTINSKGFKVLPSYYRLIQGDGVNPESIRAILDRMEMEGFSGSNIAYGMGGALLQHVNRDTQRFAYKCSAAFMADGTTRDVFKDPVTDHGKMSKRGCLDLVKDGNTFQTIQRTPITAHLSELQTVYDPTGNVTRVSSLDAIRARVNAALKAEVG